MNRRRAYTLMELLLVLAIIVIAAAAVAPSFRGVIRSTALKSAASELRAALTKAHVLAMKSGRTQMFQYELGASKYKIEPYIAGDDEIESVEGDPTGAFAGSSTSQHHSTPDKTLPEGIKFTAGDFAIESRAERIEREVGTSSSGGATWSRPILFFTDGSSVDAFIVIGNEHNSGIRIDLRGMTAALKVSDVSDLKHLENSQPLTR
jgi:prepilin-type N-terminal cleavage/methylation domain-containing protein